MSTRLTVLCFALSLMLSLQRASVQPAAAADDTATRVDFHGEVLPILARHCAKCHAGDRAKGRLRLETREHLLQGGDSGSAAVVGASDRSLLIERITESDPDLRMPQDAEPLDHGQVDILRRWIDQGLLWDEQVTLAGAAYEPPLFPRRPELPAAVDGRLNPIDRILDHDLAEQGIARPAPMDDARFMRRASLDLIGLLPTLDELTAFLDDDAADKRVRLIDHLLEDKDAYATHWLSFWNDLLRNAYAGPGFIDGGRKQITRWLYAALRNNKPYDEFVRELIDPSPQSEGFTRGIKWRGNVNASQTREIQFSQSVTQVLLGINMKCASCHNSFIDRWTLEETYSLAAVYADAPLEINRCDKPQGKMASPAWIFPELGRIDPAAPQPARLRQLASLIVHPQNGRLTRTIVNRIWHRLMGRGIVHPVDAMHTEPFSEDLLDYLAVDLADQRYDLKGLLRRITTSKAYQSQSAVLSADPDLGSYTYAGPLAKRMTVEEFLDAVWSVTGTWPAPDANAFKRDGRDQGGQLADVLEACGESFDGVEAEARHEVGLARWGSRPVRAALTRLDSIQGRLGRPHRTQIVTSRPPELTTLQAITLSNGPAFAEIINRAAKALLSRHESSPEQRVEWLFLSLLSRKPNAAESALALELVGRQPTVESVEDLLWTLLMLPEFQWIR